MKDDARAFENLTFYVNGGATKVGFNKEGVETPDDEYNSKHSIKEADVSSVEKAIRQGLIDVFRQGLTVTEKELLRKQTEQRHPGKTVLFPGDLGWDVVSKTKKEISEYGTKETLSFPQIEVRHQPNSPSEVASLAVRPFYVEQKTELVMVRRKVIDAIRRVLASELKSFDLRSGGGTTIDMVQEDATKSPALEDFIHSGALLPEFVFYFGDEFFEKEGNFGNDEIPDLVIQLQ
jgi:hypothetical protein